MKMSGQSQFRTALNAEYPVRSKYVCLFHVPFSQVHIQSSCRIRTAINSCVVCMCTCIFMSRCVVTCKPSIPVILWWYVQVGVTIAYMNGAEFFTKLSWIHYPKSIYQTLNFAMRGGETPYYRDQSTNGDIFMLSDRISFFALLSVKSLHVFEKNSQ